MRRVLLALGIILLFVGIILASYSRYPIEKWKERSCNRAEQQWEASENLSKSERIIVAVVPSEGWTEWAYEIHPHGFKVNVSIIIEDPLGEEAEFIIFYEPPPPGYKQDHPGPLPIFLSNPPFKLVKTGSLIVEEPLQFVGGIVTRNGTYRVKVIPTWWTWGPPKYIEIHVEILEKVNPYAYFLSIGVCLCFLGVAMLTLRARYPKYKIRHAKLKGLKIKKRLPSFKSKLKIKYPS